MKFCLRSGNTTYEIEATNIKSAMSLALVKHNVRKVDSWWTDQEHVNPNETEMGIDGGVQTRGEVDGDFGR